MDNQLTSAKPECKKISTAHRIITNPFYKWINHLKCMWNRFTKKKKTFLTRFWNDALNLFLHCNFTQFYSKGAFLQHGASVISCCNCPEPFLTYCIPNLLLDLLPSNSVVRTLKLIPAKKSSSNYKFHNFSRQKSYRCPKLGIPKKSPKSPQSREEPTVVKAYLWFNDNVQCKNWLDGVYVGKVQLDFVKIG